MRSATEMRRCSEIDNGDWLHVFRLLETGESEALASPALAFGIQDFRLQSACTVYAKRRMVPITASCKNPP